MANEQFQLRPISHTNTQRAREKAFRYRLLNQPLLAESICRDILAVDRDDQDALRVLILSITDQFALHGVQQADEAVALLDRLDSEYDRLYYRGVIIERKAMAQWARNLPGDRVHDMLREAMDCFERAERVSSDDNDDAILRWNTCVRILKKNPSLCPSCESSDAIFVSDEDVPLR
ncbi:MAG: hypothetical protein ACF8GE_10415 [Phycisphaerales bacterium JB043]